MQLLITGGTGLSSRHLIARLLSLSYHVTVLTRDTAHARQVLGERVRVLVNTENHTSLDNIDAIINSIGEPTVNKHWTSQ